MCSNCHATLHSKFDENISEILRNFVPNEVITEIHKYFGKLEHKISEKMNNFVENDLHNMEYSSPLKYEIVTTDKWKIKTLKLFEFLNKNDINEFRIKEAFIPFNKHYHRTYELIQRLKEQKIIKEVQKRDNTQKYFQFTERGINTIEKFREKYKEKYKEIQRNTKILQEDIVNTSKRLENDDILILYPKIIKKIIERKGFNEFTSKELQNEIKKSSAQISKIINEKLLPGGYIREIVNPQHLQKKGTTKYYELNI